MIKKQNASAEVSPDNSRNVKLDHQTLSLEDKDGEVVIESIHDGSLTLCKLQLGKHDLSSETTGGKLRQKTGSINGEDSYDIKIPNIEVSRSIAVANSSAHHRELSVQQTSVLSRDFSMRKLHRD